MYFFSQLIKMSKSNVSNGEAQAETDAIDNNNEWKVSVINIRIFYSRNSCLTKSIIIYFIGS